LMFAMEVTTKRTQLFTGGANTKRLN